MSFVPTEVIDTPARRWDSARPPPCKLATSTSSAEVHVRRHVQRLDGAIEIRLPNYNAERIIPVPDAPLQMLSARRAGHGPRLAVRRGRGRAAAPEHHWSSVADHAAPGRGHGRSPARQPHERNLDRWRQLVDRGGLAGLHRVLTALNRDSIEMRQDSPCPDCFLRGSIAKA